MDWLDTEEFDVLLAAYRTCPSWRPPDVRAAILRIQDAIRKHLRDIHAPDKIQE